VREDGEPQPVGGALTADQIDDIATQHGDWLEYEEEWVFTNHELIQFARDIEAATLSAPVAQPGEAVSEPAADARAWERRWSADGEVPAKVNGKWPSKFKMMPITKGKCFADDVPLFGNPVAAPAQAAAVPEAVIRAVVYEGLTNDTPPRLIPSPRLHSRLMDLRAALDRLGGQGDVSGEGEGS